MHESPAHLPHGQRPDTTLFHRNTSAAPLVLIPRPFHRPSALPAGQAVCRVFPCPADECCQIRRNPSWKSYRPVSAWLLQSPAVPAALPISCRPRYQLQDTSAAERTGTAMTSHSNPSAIVSPMQSSYRCIPHNGQHLLHPDNTGILAGYTVQLAASSSDAGCSGRTATASRSAAATDILRSVHAVLSMSRWDFLPDKRQCLPATSDNLPHIPAFLLHIVQRFLFRLLPCKQPAVFVRLQRSASWIRSSSTQ